MLTQTKQMKSLRHLVRTFSTMHDLMRVDSEPHVHLMAGISTYRPAPEVVATIRNRAMNYQPLNSLFDVPTLDQVVPKLVEVKHATARAFSNAASPFHTIPASQDAVFVLDVDQVRSKHTLWTEAFPSVKPYYAIKANPNPGILNYMQSAGFGFDCASASEIQAVLSAGAQPKDIIFANPCKSLDHIQFAQKMGVQRTTADSETELHKLKALHPTCEVVIRLWTDDSASQCQLSNKYGATVEEAIQLLQVAARLGLDVAGVSFHAGSGAPAPTYVGALNDAYTVFQCGLQLGFNMRVLDIGGGFPGTETEECSVRQIAALINPILKEKWQDVEVIAEPGRFFCAEAQTLAVQVVGKRTRASARQYTINDGLYQSFNCMLYDHSVLLDEPEHTATYASTIFGQTCDGLDTIAQGITLPDLRVGDWLVVPVMGAYTNGASSSFNGFPLNQCIIINA